MRVLNITQDDYANFQHENANALRSIGVDCIDVKTVLHPFGYETQSKIVSDAEIKNLIKEADIVQIFHSDLNMLELTHGIDMSGKKLIVYHTGSRYRSRPEYINKYFNDRVYASFTDQCEFMELGAKNLKYIATAINDNGIKTFSHAVEKPYVIGHYPSNPEVKGTDKILEMLNNFNGQFVLKYSTQSVSHSEQMKRLSDCDIYIELFKPELNGRPYGCYGVTAFEAAMAGKIVITQNIHKKAYEDAYGFCPFYLCNTEKEFMRTIEMILSMDITTLSGVQSMTYEYIKQKHNYKATGEYILKHIS
jgi:hypothetical protein